MFHRLLVPIKPKGKPALDLNALVAFARSSNAAIVFVSVVADPDVALTGRSAALVLATGRVRRERAASTLRQIEEHLQRQDLNVQSLVLEGNVAASVVAAARELGCDAIVLARRLSGRSASLTGRVGDTIVRSSVVPIIIMVSDVEGGSAPPC